MVNILDTIYKESAEELGIPLELVELVLHDKWQNIYANLPLHKSVEDSGLGSFKVRENTVKKRLVKLERFLESFRRKQETETSQKKLDTLQLKIDQVTEDIKYLKTKLNAVETNI
jgi:hypothetical protein